MDKRYQIFVSSTYKDLREERAKVVRAIQEGGNIPTGMELWPAASHTPWNVIDSFLKVCDYYVLIIKARYGSIDEESGLSFTEREYNRAHELGVPVLAFVYTDILGVPFRESEDDPQQRQKLMDFIAKVHSRHTTREWKNGDELMYVVGNAVRAAIDTTARPGWVRGDTAIDPKVLVEQERLRNRIRDLETQLDTAKNLPPPTAARFADLDTSISVTYAFTIEVRRYEGQSSGYFVTSMESGLAVLRLSLSDFFARVGLALWSGVSTTRLKSAIENLCQADRSAHIERTELSGPYVREVSTEPTDVNRVALQLFALGLITESDRNVPEEVIWTLTPYGRTRLVNLLARKAQT